MSYIFGKLFSGTTFASHIVCLYLEPFKSNIASKMTILTKSLQKFNVFGIIADTPRGLPPRASIMHRLEVKASKMTTLKFC